MLVAAISTIVAATSACSSHGSDASSSGRDSLMTELNDSITRFNLKWALATINRELENTSDSDRYYLLLSQKVRCFYPMGYVDSTISLANRCLEYARSRDLNFTRRRIMVQCYSMLGGVYTQYVSQPDSALACQKRALALTTPDNYPELLTAHNNLADAYKFNGDFPDAISTYQRAIFIADSVKASPADFIPLYAGIAGCYTELRNFEESARWWNRAYELWPCMPSADKSRYLNNRGNDYFYKRDYQGALRMFTQLDSLCAGSEELGWDRLLCHVNLADVYLKLGLPDSAAPLIDETMEFFTSIQANEAVMSYLYTQQMDLARQRRDFATTDRLIAAHPLPQGMRPDQAVLRLDFLRNYYAERNDAPNALKYENLYRELEDSLRDERVRQVTAELKSRHERDETILEQRVTISDGRSRLMRTYAITGFAVAAVILLLALMANQLAKRRAEQKKFHDNIVNMRMDNIRHRITPHFIYNALTHEVIAQQKGQPTQMPVLVNLLRRAQMLASDFCIPIDEELAFIKLYLKVERQACGDIDYKVEVDDDIDLHKVTLPSMTIQIFVENAVKHAFRLMPPEAYRMLRIKVNRYGSGTRIEISNNGTADDTPRPNDSTGTGMRVIYQTIQMLNERNREKIDISIGRRHSDAGPLYVVTLTIPDNFDFTSHLK